jgi:Raf kinase inhibitor-like YbhB/YbcL family protein
VERLKQWNGTDVFSGSSWNLTICIMKEKNMKSKSLALVTVVALLVVLAIPFQVGSQENQSDQWDHQKDEPFVLTSTTFADGGQLPVSMALNSPGCAPNDASGMDESPEMSWTRPKHGTRSFVVVLFDRTDGFTHWGMYNVSPEATGLPQGTAGLAGSAFGQQVDNDFGYGEQYDGPCPPTSYTPTTHDYVLTVYALDVELTLPKGSVDFPPDGEILYHKLIEAGREGHILQSASIHGFFSAVSTNPNP